MFLWQEGDSSGTEDMEEAWPVSDEALSSEEELEELCTDTNPETVSFLLPNISLADEFEFTPGCNGFHY